MLSIEQNLVPRHGENGENIMIRQFLKYVINRAKSCAKTWRKRGKYHDTAIKRPIPVNFGICTTQPVSNGDQSKAENWQMKSRDFFADQ